jgi:hypothetical protein
VCITSFSLVSSVTYLFSNYVLIASASDVSILSINNYIIINTSLINSHLYFSSDLLN